MVSATSIARFLSSKYARHGQCSFRELNKKLGARQNRSFSSLDYGHGCDNMANEDERLLNDLAYSLAMASVSDSKGFPLGHEPNRRQRRQLWFSKNQPLLDQRWVEKKSICVAGPSEDEKEAL